MINRRTAIKSFFLPFAFGLPTVQASTGGDYIRATDYADLATALAAAKAGGRRLYVPAGDYAISPMSLDVDGLTIWGDGIGRTRLISDGAVVSTPTALLRAFQCSALSLSDFSVIVQNASGAGSLTSVAIDYNALGAQIERVECVGGYGASGAGGAGFTIYQNSAFGGGYSYATLTDCTARDIPQGCGAIVNSQGNNVVRFAALRCGSTSQQHGLYVQGGENTFTACRSERSGGYNYHNYAAVPDRAASFNVYHDCASIDPTFGHAIVTSIAAGASNPDVPSGTPLNRAATFVGCTFRRTKTGPTCGQGVNASAPTLIDGCTFEDALGAAGAWLGVGAGARVVNSLFRMNATPPNLNIAGIVAAGGAIVANNQFLNWLAGSAIRADGLSVITGNALDLYGGIGLTVNGTDVQARGNVFQVHGSAKATYGALVVN